ncbi:hypothetical protein GEMRC1_003600 [Eukaryota sp. GEM-RC1]
MCNVLDTSCPHLSLVDFEVSFQHLVSTPTQKMLRLGSFHCEECFNASSVWICLHPDCHTLHCSTDPCHSHIHYLNTKDDRCLSKTHHMCLNVDTGAVFCHSCRQVILSYQSGPFAEDLLDLSLALINPSKAIKLRESRLNRNKLMSSTVASSCPNFDVETVLTKHKEREHKPTENPIENEPLPEVVFSSHAEESVDKLSELRRTLTHINLESLNDPVPEPPQPEQTVDIGESLKARKLKKTTKDAVKGKFGCFTTIFT